MFIHTHKKTTAADFQLHGKWFQQTQKHTVYNDDGFTPWMSICDAGPDMSHSQLTESF